MKQHRVSAGQVVVLFALVAVILIVFAGLSIDTAKATQRQRELQSATNSGAVGGMNAVLVQRSDSEVVRIIEKAFADNNVTNTVRVNDGAGWVDDPEVTSWSAVYLDATGASLGSVGSFAGGQPPQGVAHIIVKTSVDVDNTFSKVAGVDTFTVSANGAAGAGTCDNGVMPITFNKIYLEDRLPIAPNGWHRPVPLRDPLANVSALPNNRTRANTSVFRVMAKEENIPGNFNFTHWMGDTSNAGSSNALAPSLTGVGNLANGFKEMTPPESDPGAIAKVNGIMEVGDWLPANTGVSPSQDIKAALNEHIANKDFLILPVHDLVNGSGSSPDSGYRISRFVQVRLIGYDLDNGKYFDFALLQDNVFCVEQVPPPPPPPPGEYTYQAKISEHLLYTKPGTTPPGYDIAIVLDLSYSMRFCWDTDKLCASGSRRIDYAAKAIRSFVDEMLVQRHARGIENRLALVTFSQSGTKVIDFNNDRLAALKAFRDYFGDLSSPKTIPDSMLTGNTNGTSGIVGAVSYLSGARKVDSKNNPVKLATLFVTDGLTNVMNDGPGTNVTNRFDNAPYYCGTTAKDLDNPLVQYNCPDATKYPGKTVSQPPLKAMVRAASDASASKAITFYAVVVGAQFGLTPESMHLTQVAPGNAYMANSPEQLAGLITSIEEELGTACEELSDGIRLAANAQVTVRFAVGGPVVGTYTTNVEGIVSMKLKPGSYILQASHTVASPSQPDVPRTYNRILMGGSGTPFSQISFEVPEKDTIGPDMTLIIDNEDNAKCQ